MSYAPPSPISGMWAPIIDAARSSATGSSTVAPGSDSARVAISVAAPSTAVRHCARVSCDGLDMVLRVNRPVGDGVEGGQLARTR
jgi:hypothetical protein